MNEGELIGSGMPSLQMLHAGKQVDLISKRAGYRAQTADVLGMGPSRVMPAAVRMRNETNARRCAVAGYLTGLRRRFVRRSVDPSFTPAAASDSPSRRISKPLTFTTKSSATKPLG